MISTIYLDVIYEHKLALSLSLSFTHSPTKQHITIAQFPMTDYLSDMPTIFTDNIMCVDEVQELCHSMNTSYEKNKNKEELSDNRKTSHL